MSVVAVISFHAAGSLLIAMGGVAGVLLLLVRRRGARRCRPCGYDMTGIAGLRCPECGRVARSERSLARPRRGRRRVAACASLVISGAALMIWPRVRPANLWTWVPSPALAWIEPLHGEMSADQQCRFLDAFVPRAMSATHYSRVMRAYAKAERRVGGSYSNDIRARLGVRTIDDDGRIVMRSGRAMFWRDPWSGDVGAPPAACSVLPGATALDVAESLWGDAESGGSARSWDLGALANCQPRVADYLLARMHSEEVSWIAFAVDPRAKNGEVFRVLMADFRGDDADRRRRAACNLQVFSHRIRNEWLNMPHELAWIQKDYPREQDLAAAVREAGDELAAVVLSEASGDERRREAIKALAAGGGTWRAQSDRLLREPKGIPQELVRLLPGYKADRVRSGSLESDIEPFQESPSP